MILIGGLSTFLGLIINSRLRKNVAPHLYDERFSNDKFGILVNCSSENLEEVESILNKNGSEEIKIDGKVLEKEEAQLEEEQIVEEVKQEAFKVTWPTGKETVQGALMVVAMAIVAAIFFLLLDQILKFFLELILKVSI